MTDRMTDRLTLNFIYIDKNTLKFVCRKMKQKYYENEFSKNFRNSKQTWKNINCLLDRRQSSSITEVIDEDGHSFLGDQLPNAFNNFFSNIAPSLTRNFPVDNNSNYLNNLPINLNSCFFYPTNNEVLTNK